MGFLSFIGKIAKNVAPKVIKGIKGLKSGAGKIYKGLSRGAGKIVKGIKSGIRSAIEKLGFKLTGQSTGARGVEKVISKGAGSAPKKLSKKLRDKGKFKLPGGKPNVGGKKGKRRLTESEMDMIEM